VKTWGKQKLGFGASFERAYWKLDLNGFNGGAGFLLPQSLLALSGRGRSRSSEWYQPERRFYSAEPDFSF